MTRELRDAVAFRRLGVASCLVAALVLLVPVYDLALGGAERPADGASAALDLSSVLQAPDAESALARLEDAAEVGLSVHAKLPEALQREVGVPDGARDVRVADGGVFGYVVDVPPAQAMDQLTSHLALRGWSGVPLGGLDGATFVKEGGTCTWALATCTQVGDVTSVVVRCMLR